MYESRGEAHQLQGAGSNTSTEKKNKLPRDRSSFVILKVHKLEKSHLSSECGSISGTESVINLERIFMKQGQLQTK